jgi:hypothetical protein
MCWGQDTNGVMPGLVPGMSVLSGTWQQYRDTRDKIGMTE